MSVPCFNLTLNFANVCRLCMQTKPALLCLFSENETPERAMPLRCKIASLAPSVKVDLNDGLPTHVCRQCVNQVNVSYNFKRQCELSDAAFRNYLKNKKTGNSSAEDQQDDSQRSMRSSDDNVANWGYMNVKAELSEYQTDENSAMEQAFPVADLSLRKSQDSISNIAGTGSQQLDNVLSFARLIFDNAKSEREISRDPHGSNCNEQINSLGTRRRFACIECGKHFVQKQHLISHMRTHTGERPYRCEECGKRFSQTVHLKNHQITHTQLKPFSCSECGKCFAQNIHLKNHLATHTGEKPYGCSLCGKTFSQNVHLKNHLSTHTGEKPFRCTECGKTFSQNIHLKNHLSTHTHEKPYGCSECGRTFAQNIHLKNHIATHTGERPYGCSDCGKQFARNGQLKEHIKLHLGVKPYSCVECGKSFAQNIHLKNHMSTHSGESKSEHVSEAE